MSNVKSSKQCKSWNEFSCYTSKATEFILDSNRFKVDCLKDCPLECDFVSFETELSSLSMEENLEYIFLSVYFPALKFTEIRQTPKITFVNLLSKFGRCIGNIFGL